MDSADVELITNNIEADSLRIQPLGFDSNDSVYWYFFGKFYQIFLSHFITLNSISQVHDYIERISRKSQVASRSRERSVYGKSFASPKRIGTI